MLLEPAQRTDNALQLTTALRSLLGQVFFCVLLNLELFNDFQALSTRRNPCAAPRRTTSVRSRAMSESDARPPESLDGTSMLTPRLARLSSTMDAKVRRFRRRYNFIGIWDEHEKFHFLWCHKSKLVTV